MKWQDGLMETRTDHRKMCRVADSGAGMGGRTGRFCYGWIEWPPPACRCAVCSATGAPLAAAARSSPSTTDGSLVTCHTQGIVLCKPRRLCSGWRTFFCEPHMAATQACIMRRRHKRSPLRFRRWESAHVNRCRCLAAPSHRPRRLIDYCCCCSCSRDALVVTG